MIILDNHQATNSREVSDITFCLSLWMLLCMIVSALGIKIWWFRHRSSFEQAAKGNDSTAEGATDITAPLVPQRRRNKWIFSKDKRYSQQISQSAAEIHGIFRIRQDENFSTQNNPTVLLPNHARKISESAPSLLSQEQNLPRPLSRDTIYESSSASTSKTSQKPTQRPSLIFEALNRPVTHPKVLESSLVIEPCNRNAECINNNEIVVKRQENRNSYIKCEEIDSQVQYIYDLQMLKDLKNCKENLIAKDQEKKCPATIDSANNTAETRPLQDVPIRQNGERSESTETPAKGCPANYERNQLNEDWDLLKDSHSFVDSERLEDKSHDLYYDSVATNQERISNPSLKFADNRKSLHMNVKCVDDLKEKSLSNIVWPTQFRAKDVQKMIARRLSKCSLLNLNKTKTNFQLNASDKKELERHAQNDFTENSRLSNTPLSTTIMSTSDNSKCVNHCIRCQEHYAQPEQSANPSSIRCEHHRKLANHEGEGEISQNAALGSSRSTNLHVTFENPLNFNDENNLENCVCNVAIKERRPTGYEPPHQDIRDLTDVAIIPGIRHQAYDYSSSPRTDSIRNVDRNLFEIADREDFLNLELEKKSLSGLISKDARARGCSGDMGSSKQMKKSKDQHVAFKVLEEFDINRKTRNSALTKRRPTGLQEEENLHDLRGAFELDDNISSKDLSFDFVQNSSDSKSLGIKDFNKYQNLSHDDYQLSEKSLLQHTPMHYYPDKKQNSISLGSVSCKASEKLSYAKPDSNSLISNRDNNDYDDRHSWGYLGKNIHEDFVKNIEEEFSKIRLSYVHSKDNCPDTETITQMQQPASYGETKDEGSNSFGKQLDCLKKNLKDQKKKTKDFQPSIHKEFHTGERTNDKNKLRKSRVTFDISADECDVVQEKPDQPDNRESIKTGLKQTRLSLIKLNYNEESEDSWSAIRKYRNLTKELNEHMNEDTSMQSSYRNPLAQLKQDRSYEDELEEVENLKLNSIKSPVTSPRAALEYRREIINLEERHNVNESSEA
ncbi:uncharacterized protein LOC119632714 [Glossina fuscipes]|uniref:Uncharacterized protein LOC119632714 n=1 Tax=Glossina fuscipes TaxID=7396 RepID=A0A8U0W8M6_9MUSC|nr:uncharacterized protein LOC119632714 [Glossina fuscipes]KAI9587861.1 hypothetical protein GQX74_003707 [Glossina fuscipes]